ncbi:SGNH/GDSL hydrolase family protein [Verrucomicrobiota bacterium sgz303538]
MSPLRALAISAFSLVSTLAHGEFTLRDGDTVAFLGDSITAARGYTKIVEHYTMMRFPERKVHFVNAGQGGDTASGCLQRLERDVFSQGATVVTVAFGINDIGWGTKANEQTKQRYLDGIREIIEKCRARNVRPIICSAAITAEAPEKAENGFLQKMTDEGLALAKSMGAETIDLQRGMREIQRRVVTANEKEQDKTKHNHLHVADGVHLSDLGQLAMAYAMIKGLGAPEDVSSATLDAETCATLTMEGCKISDLQKQVDGLTFTRTDDGLPITLGTFSWLDFRWVPIPDGINRYMLSVKNLPAGEYEISAEGRGLGKANAEQLARGLNIFAMRGDPWEPGGPWDAQSLAVRELVDARDKVWMSGQIRSKSMGNHPQKSELENNAANLAERLFTFQRAMAKPYAYHFVLKRIPQTANASVSAGDAK